MTGLLVPIVTVAVTYYGTEQQRQETARQQIVQIANSERQRGAQAAESERQRVAQAAEAERQRKAQAAEAERQREFEASKRRVENARLALDIYIKTPTLFDPRNADSAKHIAMLAAISDNDELKAVFNEMQEQIIAKNRAGSDTPAKAAANLPDRFVAKPAPTAYPNYLVYVQAKSTDVARGRRVVEELRKLNFKAPGVDTKISGVPTRNEIRYYRVTQAEVAERLAGDLEKIAGEKFIAVPLGDPALPDGIMEVWITEKKT